MSTTNHRTPYYTTTAAATTNSNDRLFQDGQIQRFDADTIKNRYGENWRNFASNVREITQPDGSIVKEYIIEDPTVLERMQNSSQRIDSISSTTMSDDEQQMNNIPLKNRFAQIKAKFEQKQMNYVMESPSNSSTTASSTTTTTARSNSHKPSDDLYAKHRRGSNESVASSQATSNVHQRSQSLSSEKSKPSTLRRLDSADEADEEVRRIHRQGEELRRFSRELSPISSVNEAPLASRVQYEVLDEDGNPMAIDGVQDLIQMSGVRAREVTQPDGTIVKEYVIDDPEILSKFRPQSTDKSSPMPVATTTNTTAYVHHQIGNLSDAPPPPPRVPLRQPILFRPPGISSNEQLPINIQQITVLEPQRRYEFITTSGRRIQFLITQINDLNGQPINDADIRELSQAIHMRLGSSNGSSFAPSTHVNPAPFTNPKQWFPSVDFTQRTPSNRQRIGSDTQMGVPQEVRQVPSYQQIPADLTRSASYGALNQMGQPTIDWNSFRQGPVQVRPQSNGPVQTSAQFLPHQHQQQQQQQYRTTSTVSPPVYYQQQQQQQQQAPMADIRYVQPNGYSYGQARI